VRGNFSEHAPGEQVQNVGQTKQCDRGVPERGEDVESSGQTESRRRVVIEERSDQKSEMGGKGPAPKDKCQAKGSADEADMLVLVEQQQSHQAGDQAEDSEVPEVGHGASPR